MNNIYIFDAEKVKTALDPFLPGSSEYITPIKYEAITPDIFAFMFRTHGKDDNDHFFAFLEFDHLQDINEAAEIIEPWASNIYEFFPPKERQEHSGTLETLRYDYKNNYYGLLARIERPKGKGYWATYTTINIMNPDLRAELAKVPPEKQAALLKTLQTINEKKSYGARSITMYTRPNGTTDFFYN